MNYIKSIEVTPRNNFEGHLFKASFSKLVFYALLNYLFQSNSEL